MLKQYEIRKEQESNEHTHTHKANALNANNKCMTRRLWLHMINEYKHLKQLSHLLTQLFVFLVETWKNLFHLTHSLIITHSLKCMYAKEDVLKIRNPLAIEINHFKLPNLKFYVLFAFACMNFRSILCHVPKWIGTEVYENCNLDEFTAKEKKKHFNTMLFLQNGGINSDKLFTKCYSTFKLIMNAPQAWKSHTNTFRPVP